MLGNTGVSCMHKASTGVKNRSIEDELPSRKQVMLRFFGLVIILILFDTVLLKDSDQMLVRSVDSSFQRESSSFFLFHLLKLKKIQQIETVPTVPPPSDCICVPYYICSANRTIITDGIIVIDVRYRRCTGDLEVCCRIPNITTTTTTTTTTTMRTTTTTKATTTTTTPKPTTTTSTLPPVVFPSTATPTTQVCVCVLLSQCDPNGIVGTYGEGIINPRLQGVQCPSSNQVCCRPNSVIQYTNPTSQTCVLCGNTIQCNNGIVIPVNPLLTSGQCPVPTSCCQGVNPTYGNGIQVVLGPVKYSGTPQACYCMMSWLCSPGNTVTVVGTGIIDPRFSACGSADQVCCRANVLSGQRAIELQGRGESVVNGESSFSRVGCGVQNKTYAPAQPYPADSEKTYFAEFPWMVALLTVQSDGKYLFQCGGSLITDKAVLTAAHCVANEGRWVARIGQWNLSYQPGDQPLPYQTVNVKNIVIHPQFDRDALLNDIAVLILNEPVKQSINVVPICIPQQGLIFPAGTRCIGTGWGKNSFGGTYQTELRKVQVPIVDRNDCQNRLRTTALGPNFQLHSSFTCAGGEANRDTCRGDGGGPLICPSASGQFFQAGIVSWGIGCGTSNIPAVYTNVAQYTQWIEQQLVTYGA
ncbi:uncharacterized protein LOC100880265 [Megachile rotundata]|uniref:uncharacterized protein LOC100880265 n=1 Tax=Megachile rotundata TaxID=143995 RepID=UPI003FD09F5B